MMKICIMAQEEPVCFSPFLRKVIQKRSKDVVLVILAGSRGAGNHPKNLSEKWKSLSALWLMWEPKGFLRALGIRMWFAVVRCLGLTGSWFDPRSVRGIAKKLNIPVYETEDVNSKEVLELLREKDVDVIINQGEILLGQEILAIPKMGIINRHASLLPHFRGRVGSFWSHAHEPPEYGVTIHFVDQDIDSGPIIVQKQFDLDPRLPYAKVLEALFEGSVALMIEALEALEAPGFTPLPNNYQGTVPCLFPTLEEVKEYRGSMRKRRSGAKRNKAGSFFLIVLWLITVVGFHYLCDWPMLVSFSLAVSLPVIYWRSRSKALIRSVIIIGFIGMVVALGGVKPSNTRDWPAETAVLPTISIKDHYVTIHGYRNFRWRDEQDFDPIWEERTYDLHKLSGLDLIVEPFKASDLLAHTMLGFNFQDGGRVIVSVEARREKQETYSLIAGAFRQFELIYLFGDENDLLALRAVQRGARIYEFPVKADQAFMISLFTDLAVSANALHKRPEFYRSIRDNCTTTLVKHIDHVYPKEHIGLRFSTVFPARTGRLLYRSGHMKTGLSYEQAKEVFRTDESIRNRQQ